MVLFNFNNVQSSGSPVSIAAGHREYTFRADVLAPVKFVKRHSSQPWPFFVKSSVVPDIVEASRQPQAASSLLT